MMHATVKGSTLMPLKLKNEMNPNMTIFLVYALVGKNPYVFKPKKNNAKKPGWSKGINNEPALLDSVPSDKNNSGNLGFVRVLIIKALYSALQVLHKNTESA